MTTTAMTSASNANSSASSAILQALGSGSGIDVNGLVNQLAEAQKAPQQALLDQRQAVNGARVSALGQMANAIDGFAAALRSLLDSGSLYSQPAVSDTSIFTATAMAGSRIGNL